MDRKGVNILSLSYEVIQQIVEEYVQQISTEADVGNVSDPRPWVATIPAKSALCKLALTCKKFLPISRAALYKHVILLPKSGPPKGGTPTGGRYLVPPGTLSNVHAVNLESVDSLVLFLRTLIENPELGKLVQQLDCRMLLSDVPGLKMMELASYGFPGLMGPTYQLLSFENATRESWARYSTDIRIGTGRGSDILRNIGRFDDGDPNLAQRIFAAILYLTPGLQCLALEGLPCPQSTPDLDLHTFRYSCLDRLVTSALSSRGETQPFLSRLKSLAIRYDYRLIKLIPTAYERDRIGRSNSVSLGPVASEKYPIGTLADCCPSLLEAPGLQRLTSSCNIRGWQEISLLNSQLRHIILHTGDPRKALLEVFERQPCLEEFRLLTANSERSKIVLQLPTVTKQAINQVILRRASTLKILELSEPQIFYGLFKTAEGLGSCCLPYLHQLQHLTMHISLLESVEGYWEEMERLDMILPPKIKTLKIDARLHVSATLEAEGECEQLEVDAEVLEEQQSVDRTRLSKNLSRLAARCNTAYPSLWQIKIVGYVLPWWRNVYRTRPHELPPLRQVFVNGPSLQSEFARVGVEFFTESTL